MARVRLDELEQSKLDKQGDSISDKTGKEAAQALVAQARAELPNGVPDSSPYKKFSRDDLLAEAARLEMRMGPLMAEEDLRLVIEVLRIKMTNPQGLKTSVEMPPPAPNHVPKPKKMRGLKPSASNTWRVTGRTDKDPPVSVGNGQMAKFKNGAVIEMRHYSPQIVQALVDQGLKLVPIEDGEDDEG